jgi:hypothetical protein
MAEDWDGEMNQEAPEMTFSHICAAISIPRPQ